MKTGLDDDRRRPLRRGDALYGAALIAYEWQDRWSAGQHYDFWTWLVEAWPRERGQRQLRETIGWWAHTLRRYGLADADIAEVVGVESDTLRRRRAFDVGDMIFDEQIEKPWQRAAATGPLRPLPRVYERGDDEPPFSWVNLPMASKHRPREVVAIEMRAMAKLAELRGEPVGWQVQQRRRSVEERYCATCYCMATLDHFDANPAHARSDFQPAFQPALLKGQDPASRARS